VSVTDTLHEHHRTLLDPGSRRGCSRARQVRLVRQTSARRFRCPGFHVPSLAATALRRVSTRLSDVPGGQSRTRRRMVSVAGELNLDHRYCAPSGASHHRLVHHTTAF
jgi:hypothetical protein